MKFVQNRSFWQPFVITVVICVMFFSWELGVFKSFLPSLPRPEVTTTEIYFTIALTLLMSWNVGLFNWQKKNGSCPIGAKRASGIAGGLGALALICPACVLLPFTIFGTSVALAAFGPYIPLLQILSIFLLIVSAIMMRPKSN